MFLNKAYLKEVTNQNRQIYQFSERHILAENNIKFKTKNSYDIFLSHSSLDKDLVLTLIKLFNDAGYSVYVDWINDYELDRSNVSKNTASILKMRMQQSRGLSFLTTQNSTNSKWCPWELGYFDGLKNSRCCILPVLNNTWDTFHGQEYLGLYPYIMYDKVSGSNRFDFWVYDSDHNGNYVILSSWLNGTNPYSRN